MPHWISQRKSDSAISALHRVADEALLLGIKRKSPLLGNVATSLSTIAVDLQCASRAVIGDDSERLVQTADWLAHIYDFKSERERPLDVLANVGAALRTSVGQQRLRKALIRLEDEHSRSLTARASSGKLSDLQRLAESIDSGATSTMNGRIHSDVGHQVPQDYPQQINSELYQVLNQHLQCGCACSGTLLARGHQPRLCLSSDVSIRDQCVAFDMVFSGSRDTSRRILSHWQQVRLLLPKQTRSRKKTRVTFEDSGAGVETAGQTTQLNSLRDDFCNFLNQGFGPVWVHLRVDDRKLLEVPTQDEGQHYMPCDSISLADVLTVYDLTAKMKLVLAYILAHSVWRYYSSDWMRSRWSTDSIHFLKEYNMHQDASGEEYFVYAYQPCFHLPPDGQGDTLVELYEGRAVHSYPRVLALGILLLELGRKRPGPPTMTKTPDNMGAQINVDQARYRYTVRQDKEWPYFDQLGSGSIKGVYSEIVGRCFDGSLFNVYQDQSAQNQIGPSSNVSDFDTEQRRALLYKHVVGPLSDLLEQLGWKEIQQMDPMRKHDQNSMNEYLASAENGIKRTHAAIPIRPAQKTESNNSHRTPAKITNDTTDTPDRTQFEVAIVCALQLEADAVLDSMEKIWHEKRCRSTVNPKDPNAYTLGSLAGHPVVVVHMPGIGETSASSVAANMSFSFPNIKLAVVVGVCGGVPQPPGHQEGVFLGDLILSTLVVPYDFGRRLPNRIERIDDVEDVPGQQNPKIRGIMAKLGTRIHKEAFRSTIQAHTTDLAARYPVYREPLLDTDILHDPSYLHKHRTGPGQPACPTCGKDSLSICDKALSQSCAELGCDPGRSIARSRHNLSSAAPTVPATSARVSSQAAAATAPPAIHFGRIGSGNMVIKCGLNRDEMAARDAVIAFEMEGAGVWDKFPTVVMKGVCDYADSHKSKEWQGYAAAVAAGGLKAFLGEW